MTEDNRRPVSLNVLAGAGATPRSAAADYTVARLAFLAAAGQVLSASLDYTQTLQHVSELAVPTLGDLCILDIVEDGQLRRLATAHVDAGKAALLRELRDRYPASGDSPQPAGRVLRTGEPELLVDVTPDVIASHARDVHHAQLIHAIGIRSHLAVPLIGPQGMIGVISLGITESDRRYGGDDVAFAQDLARQAALAVENARLYRRAQLEIAERQRAEQALRFSESRFRAMVEQSPLSIQIFDATGAPIRANRAWEALWGVTLDRIPEYNILRDPQLEKLGIAPLIKRAFAGEAVEIPAVRYDPNETLADRTTYADPVRWVRAFAYPVKDESGSVREVVLVHEDVTGARKAEEQLRASEERLRLALSAARMNVWDWDLTSDRVECSANAREFWGIEVGQAGDFYAAVHPDDHALLEEAGGVALRTGEYTSEYRLVHPDRPVRWVQSRGRVERSDDGRPVRVLGVTIDITDLKLAEQGTRLLADAGEILGASLDYHVTLQNLARVLVPRFADWCAVDLLTDSGTLERVLVHHPDPKRIALANRLFEAYPARPDGAIGPWHVVTSGGPEWAAEITGEMLQALAQSEEHLHILRDLNLQSYICVPLVARGAPIGVLSVACAESGRRYRQPDVELAMDVARRIAAAIDNARLYQQLRREDRRKDEFVATLAHELRNPLAPIRTGLALLRVAPQGEVADKTRDVIERQLGHMVRLIDDLLDVSRITRGRISLEKERVDLWSIVGSALETSRPLIDAAGLQLTVRLPETPVVLDADRTRLGQVLSNLLNNASKYTPRGGRVELDATVEGAAVAIRVSDSGVGIPPEMLGHVFEMFTQLDVPVVQTQGGLGIGLTLVRSLVELHGGRVWAESDGPGKGSTFVVRLPLATAVAPVATAPSGEAARSGAGAARRVLVVDDNVDAAETLAALLKADGHDVRVAFTGPAALDLLEEFRPEVAFLDIGLPQMSGYELARRLRERPDLAHVTLVALTGWGQREDRRQSSEAGFDHHLTKPVNPREIQNLIADAPVADSRRPGVLRERAPRSAASDAPSSC